MMARSAVSAPSVPAPTDPRLLELLADALITVASAMLDFTGSSDIARGLEMARRARAAMTGES